MSLILPTDAKFNVGTSGTDTVSKVDMSLDDIMKSRREQAKSTNRRAARRTDPKKNSSTPKTAAQNSNKRRQGARRASKDAAVNSRRGIRTSRAPTKMEIDQEMKKETKKPAAKTARKKTIRFQENSKPVRARPPTKKAIQAAVTAMTGAGFKVPDGMKVVISVEKDEDAVKNNNKNNGGKNNNRGGGRRPKNMN